MLKKTIVYTDFNGVERKEDFYFHLSRAELMKMELGTKGGFTEMIEKIIAAQDSVALTTIFNDIILKAYGKKSDDGRKFMKSKEISEDFEQTEAYSILFMELISDAKKAADFFNGIVPADLETSTPTNS